MSIKKDFDPVGLQMSDPTLIRIIIQNLLSNAIKYTPQSGSITLTLAQEKDVIIVKVADSGCGIPLSAQKDIFHKFFRADNVRDTK